MPKSKKKIDSPVIDEVTIVPAKNGFTVKISTKDFTTKRYICQTIIEVCNALKTLNWDQDKETKTLNDSLKSEE